MSAVVERSPSQSLQNSLWPGGGSTDRNMHYSAVIASLHI